MKYIRSYFSFSRKELNGIILLLTLVLITLSFPVIYRYYSEDTLYDTSNFELEILELKEQISKARAHQPLKEAIKAEYFMFDPNMLDEKSWRKLGLSDKQIKVIYKYESKGGKFNSKEDLKKMYSISAEQYLKLEPYIRIVNPPSFEKKSRKISFINAAREKQNTEVVMVEINSADSAMLTAIRGIGPAFASRIIRYRNRLGGFYKKEQLKEVYGLDSAKFQQISDQIVLNSKLISRIDLNSATFEQLKKHPYLTYKQMNAILQYRRQHGPFGSIDELNKVALLNEEIIRKIEPYISFNP